MQIEEGKYYKTRDGRKVGPIKRGYTSSPALYWTAPEGVDEAFGSAWHQDGQFWPAASDNWTKRSFAFDLVSEWSEWPTGPVVTETVTKTRIVPGVYDRITVNDEGKAGMVGLWLNNGHYFSADQLDAAAAVLSALARGLRDA